MLREAGQVQAEQAGGDALGGFEPLVGAKPADLGDELAHVGDPLCGTAIGDPACCGRPASDHDRLVAGERGPQCLGDERCHRVQQPQHDVKDMTEHGPGALRAISTVGELPLGQLEVPVTELVPHEVVQRLA
jgi:hypothetical protein